MRFSSSSLIAASTAVAALLLAACASHGVVPATNSFGPSVVSPEAVSPDAKKPTPKPCAKPQTPWDFGGACGAVAIKAGGGSASMSAYDGFTIKATFPKAAPAPAAGEILVVRDATNTKKDVTGVVKQQVFPPFNKAGSPSTTVTPLLYMKAHNQGGGFTFTGTPLLTVTSVKPFPGKDCILTKMISSTTGFAWQASPVVFGKISGKTVVFPSQTTQIPIPKNGTVYLAMACFNP